ncbi:hypothetical protein EYF80_064165 [Liparis tanakae]|uniref:Uncharacterized protein n=1 Tax=Liparis tanakae TaxID=230148 RepID=A0A4Z2EAF8_9TELE|nr:hypothetical protein EYF80_064165 [Liparis tanakae]
MKKKNSDEAPPGVGPPPPRPPPEARRGANGVVARPGEEEPGEARVQVVLPPEEAGQRGQEGAGAEGGGAKGVPEERGQAGAGCHMTALPAELMGRLVELRSNQPHSHLHNQIYTHAFISGLSIDY